MMPCSARKQCRAPKVAPPRHSLSCYALTCGARIFRKVGFPALTPGAPKRCCVAPDEPNPFSHGFVISRSIAVGEREVRHFDDVGRRGVPAQNIALRRQQSSSPDPQHAILERQSHPPADAEQVSSTSGRFGHGRDDIGERHVLGRPDDVIHSRGSRICSRCPRRAKINENQPSCPDEEVKR